MKPSPFGSTKTSGYSSYKPPSSYGTYVPGQATGGYYGYAEYAYQEPDMQAFGGTPAPIGSVDASQVYNYSYPTNPGYYNGYSYGTSGITTPAQPGSGGDATAYYSSSKAPSYMNSGSG